MSAGRATATALGTSSPTTICTTVARASATMSDTVRAVPVDRKASRGDRSTRATVGSATTPSTTEAMVMPSCTPERCNESCSRDRTTMPALSSPPDAATSIWLRSTATRANSTATKNALARMSARAPARPRVVTTRDPIVASRGRDPHGPVR